jgi:hypothetical protein
MGAEHQRKKRRLFQWSDEAKELVEAYAQSVEHGYKTKSSASLTNQVVALTGNPRAACIRFLGQHGVRQNRIYRFWTKPEQQRLIDLMETCPIVEIARIMQRTPCSVRSMLQRLGESAQGGRDWFTIYSLAEALHIRATEVQKWIDNGWLKCRIVETTGIKKRIIDPDDFCDFARQYGPTVIGRRLSYEGLKFVQTFVFPPKHSHLFSLRKPEDRAEPDENAAALEESA